MPLGEKKYKRLGRPPLPPELRKKKKKQPWWKRGDKRLVTVKTLPRYKIAVSLGSGGGESVVRVVDTWAESGYTRWGKISGRQKQDRRYLAARWGTVRKWLAKGIEGKEKGLAEAGALVLMLNEKETTS